MFLISSDWHCQPDELIPQARELIRMAQPGRDILVGVGDLFDFLPLGKDEFKNSKAIDDFIDALGGQTFYYVAGNHDPYRWVSERFRDYPNIIVMRSKTFEDKWHCRHGHGWSHDWWLLQHFAAGLVEHMAEYFPGFWYWFSRRMGWIPSTYKRATKAPPFGSPREMKKYLKERQKYNDKVGVVWRNAIRCAQHENVSVIVGHTHCSGILKRATMDGIRGVIADGGDLRDGTYVLIGDDIQLCTLP